MSKKTQLSSIQDVFLKTDELVKIFELLGDQIPAYNFRRWLIDKTYQSRKSSKYQPLRKEGRGGGQGTAIKISLRDTVSMLSSVTHRSCDDIIKVYVPVKYMVEKQSPCSTLTDGSIKIQCNDDIGHALAVADLIVAEAKEEAKKEIPKEELKDLHQDKDKFQDRLMEIMISCVNLAADERKLAQADYSVILESLASLEKRIMLIEQNMSGLIHSVSQIQDTYENKISSKIKSDLKKALDTIF